MILASCRKNFDSNQIFGDLRFRRYPSLPDITEFTEMTAAEVAAEVEDRHVLALVHGYRNPLKAVAEAYEKLASELEDRALIGPGNYDLAIGFIWPGFQTATVGFFAAVPSANRSAGAFREFLKLLNSHAHTVDVQTHSLGARVALQALAMEHEVFVDNLMLAAPAVDNECLEPKQEFNNSLLSCRRCLVYHSSHDNVLKIGYVIAGLDRALGHKGPAHPKIIKAECPDVFVIDASIVKGHSNYRKTPEVYDHWTRVLAEEPLPQFETMKKDAG